MEDSREKEEEERRREAMDGGPLMCVMMSHRVRSVTWSRRRRRKRRKGRSLSKGCGTILTHRGGRWRVSGCVLEILYYVQPPCHSYIFCALKYPQT